MRKQLPLMMVTLVAWGLILSAVPQRSPALSADSDMPLTPGVFVNIAKKVLPSVVSIEVSRDMGRMQSRMPGNRIQPRTPQEFEDFLRRFFDMPGPLPDQPGPPQPEPEEDPETYKYKSAGSGFIIHVDGSTAYIMTNAHVIQGANNGDISVILDVSLKEAKIQGDRVEVVDRDNLGDLAVLKVDLGEIEVRAAEWGDSDRLEVGEWVLALGNPLELRNSVTQGIISAKHREIYKSAIEDLLQTTAAINPGNSGGPLVNLDGKVVGVNNAIATRTGLWQGVGFAIPSNYARQIAEQIITQGRVSRGYLGIEMAELDEKVAGYFGLEKTQGIIVRNVHPDSSAEKAGVKPYDIITAVDGKEIRNPADMLRVIATKEVGSKAELTVWRESTEEGKKAVQLTLTALLGERPSDEELASMQRSPQSRQDAAAKLGLLLEPTAPGDDPAGLQVKGVERGSAAAKAGLREGDVILQLNRQEVKTLEEFVAALGKRSKGRDHLVLYSRNGMNNFTTLEAGK